MPKRIHSTMILVAVFGLGIAGGIAGMVWAWPGLRSHLFPHNHESGIEQLQKTLSLDPAQVPQVKAIYEETGERSHSIHLQFVPAYNQICNEYTQTRSQERAAFAPIRQQELDKLHAVLNPEQWAKVQQRRAEAEKDRAQHQPDVCRHMDQARPSDQHAAPIHTH